MASFLQRIDEVDAVLSGVTLFSGIASGLSLVSGMAAGVPFGPVAVLALVGRVVLDNAVIQEEGQKFFRRHQELEEYEGRTQKIVDTLEPAIQGLRQEVIDRTAERDELVVQIDLLKEKICKMDALNGDLQREVSRLTGYVCDLGKKNNKIDELNQRYERAVSAKEQCTLKR